MIAAYIITRPRPQPVGAAYNPLSLGHELMIRPSCSNASSTIEIGSGAANQYIYWHLWFIRHGTIYTNSISACITTIVNNF